ncbi:hypothetical protein GIB67_038426 [Kingdonia uniflora]|uniref:RNase H type-1 domain-containing protein n=1 Tax=Kingdonia uniflora TaxID=39325 RepID=A0A7J7NP27_9MAGN|nr:hypothetical protein GIB67_038426 [Kingdonia uniflora]
MASQEPWNMESGNEGSSKELRHGRTAHNISSSSLQKKFDLLLVSKVKIGLLSQFLANLQEVILGTKLAVLFPAIPLAIITQCYNFGRVNFHLCHCCCFARNNVNSQILLLDLLSHMLPLMFRYHSDGSELEGWKCFCIQVQSVKREIGGVEWRSSLETRVRCSKVEDSARNRHFNDEWDLEWTLLQPTQCKWLIPQPGFVMVNTDGALNNVRGGIGAVVREEKGIVLRACAEYTHKSSITVHELQSIDRGLKNVIELGSKKVILGSDSKAAISIVQLIEDPLEALFSQSLNI